MLTSLAEIDNIHSKNGDFSQKPDFSVENSIFPIELCNIKRSFSVIFAFTLTTSLNRRTV